MKRSKRLIRNTIYSLLALMVLSIVISRFLALDAEPRPARVTTEELTALRDFTVVRAQGDFSVDIVQQADFSVEFSPAGTTEGTFRALSRENQLVLIGNSNPPGSHVRIGMPLLREFSAEAVPAVSVTGFTSDSITLRAETVPLIELRDNAVAEWRVAAGRGSDVQVDATTMANGKIRMFEQATISILE